MNDIFLGVVVLLLLGMIIMMFKYAKYIHTLPNLPKTENKNLNKDERSESGTNSDTDQEND